MTHALLFDTHAAIWFAEGRLSSAGLDAIRAAYDAILVSPVSAWEIGLLTRPRGDRPPRLDLQLEPEAWFALLLKRPRFGLAPLTPTMAIAASFLLGVLHDAPPTACSSPPLARSTLRS